MDVQFVHKLPVWQSPQSWQPVRLREEGYSIDIFNRTIVIDAPSSWALSNAMSTLFQLLEVKQSPKNKATMQLSIPHSPHHIRDRPAFPYRGLLLDTARTFYPVEYLKTLISQLTEFKINVLHLHLTDTSAWSLEVTDYPELVEHLSYKDINGEDLSYSRKQVRDLVEFARLRGLSLLPEIDGPAHAPALAQGKPLDLTVAASADFSTGDFAVEAPAGSWNYSDSRVTSLLNNVFQQLNNDFTTAPYIHVGGDEPRASSLCEALQDAATRLECLKSCTEKYGGSPYAANCAVLARRPADANQTFWFPDVLNQKIQTYFNDVVPKDLSLPVAAWSGTRVDMGVTLPRAKRAAAKPMLQLWEFPASAETPGLTKQDCLDYDLVQSSATHPQGKTDAGWMYLECGAGQNWISMAQNYWCSRASWVSMYSQNITQHYESSMASRECQDAFAGAEMGIWGEITGVGNSMSLIFPRAAAFAERVWTNPPALSYHDLTDTGAPPAQYWDEHLKDALARLNTVVENLDLRGIGVSRLQPKFCHDHPEYCTNYTNSIYHPPQQTSSLMMI